MSPKRIVSVMSCIFYLVLTGSALAVEPTTFPGTKDRTVPNKAALANPKSAPQVKVTPDKLKNAVDVKLKPMIAEPKVAPKTKKE